MEIEHLIGLGVVVVFSALASWLVWSCMCKSEDEEDCVESQDEIKSVNSRTRVISATEIGEDISHHQPYKEKFLPGEDQLQEVFIAQPVNNKTKGKGKGKNSCYVQTGRDARFADPFGEWTRRE